jgi:RNA polymerase sigma-70 factor (ECF subfamily)
MLSLFLMLIEDHENDSKFEAIYNDYHDMLYNIAFGITKNHYDAEESMQIALFTIAEDIANIKTDNIPMLKSYLYKITKNASIDFLRSKKRVSSVLNIDDFLFVSADEDITYSIEGDEQYQQIVKCILQMPSIYRDVLALHFLKEMPTIRISRILKRKHCTVKQQLNRGTKLLRAILKEAGLA